MESPNAMGGEPVDDDGIDRRGFMKCMAWTGTGVVWAMAGGIMKSFAMGEAEGAAALAAKDFSFVQISDSHVGFNKEANPNVVATLQAAARRIGAMPARPDFVVHTGDISHLARAEQFDTVDQVLAGARLPHVFYVPGEHDVAGDEGKLYRAHYGKNARGAGWYSFDHRGVHFIGLVNVMSFQTDGMGLLGADQLEWLEKDLAGRSSSTPIVVFAHFPLWMVYAPWGWGTGDGARALGYLKRFGSVTVLNGHIHQVMQKIEGGVAFHTAMSTAFPQPKPGSAPGPGPMKVPPGELRSVLGVTDVTYVQGKRPLALVDSTLQSA